MNDDEIKVLKDAAKSGPLFWRFDASEPPQRVIRIGGPPPVEEGDVEEPGLCAYLEAGGYVALWNAEPAQFVTMAPIDYAAPNSAESVGPGQS